MMTRWRAGTSVETEWECWVRETAAGLWMWAYWRWVVHSWSRRFIICQSCGFMCCWERNETFMHYFATLWYSTQTGRLSRHVLSQILLYFASYQNVFILPLLSHLSYPTASTTVFFVFTAYYSFPPLRFFIPQRDLIMFWIKVHMWIMSEKCSMTNCRHWAQLTGNWATSSWRRLPRVEIDG